MYRNVLFRAIIDRMQWGQAGRGSEETAAEAQELLGEVGGGVPPGYTVSDNEGPQMLTLLFTHLSEQQREWKKIWGCKYLIFMLMLRNAASDHLAFYFLLFFFK